MGCLCSRESNPNDYVVEVKKKEEEKKPCKSPVPVIAPLKREEEEEDAAKNGAKAVTELDVDSSEEIVKNRVFERPRNGHRRHSTMDLGRVHENKEAFNRIVSMPHGNKGEIAAAGWPNWLASVSGEAVKGWSPRTADSYEKLNKIGQGTYSTVYKARDRHNNKIVALKKVRFVNMDPESVRFMAREICILRRLDHHPNVMKLEAVASSRVSGSLYLVFEYMEHDFAGLLASPKVKFSEAQIKCLAKQLLCGLEHCHSRGVLHRDIKGSNLLVDSNGVLKIGDFGLANFYGNRQSQPLTSRVVTLWYRAPELLLGSTNYGPAIDLWSVGCLLAESFAGKPIMPGRTEVEQMHKILKLCGSAPESFWKKTKLPHAASFKSQRQYKRRVADTFIKELPSSALALVEILLSIDPEERGTASSALKTEFFTKNPLPCDPSSLPKYPPSKELDAKIRKRESSVKTNPKNNSSSLKSHNQEEESHSNKIAAATNKSSNHMTMEESSGGRGGGGFFFPIEPSRVKNGVVTHSNSAVHPDA
ncbi:hypothetical protein M569_08134, partial [Genlisea aurea]